MQTTAIRPTHSVASAPPPRPAKNQPFHPARPARQAHAAPRLTPKERQEQQHMVKAMRDLCARIFRSLIPGWRTPLRISPGGEKDAACHMCREGAAEHAKGASRQAPFSLPQQLEQAKKSQRLQPLQTTQDPVAPKQANGEKAHQPFRASA